MYNPMFNGMPKLNEKSGYFLVDMFYRKTRGKLIELAQSDLGQSGNNKSKKLLEGKPQTRG